MVSDMDSMLFCMFNLCDVRIAIAITCIVPKSVSGGSFIRVKSVKEELIGRPLAITNFNMRDIWRTVPDS